MISKHLPVEFRPISDLEYRLVTDPENVSLWWQYADRFADLRMFYEADFWYQKALQASDNQLKALNIKNLISFYNDQHLYVTANRLTEDHKIYLDTITNTPVDIKSVTFYINCYNTEKYIDNAILSALNQSYPINELLIIDDGGQDQSRDIAERYARKYPIIRIIDHQGKRLGLAASRNTALYAAKGEFLATIDTDDIADRYWLERLMLNFTQPEIAGVGGKVIEQFTLKVVDRWRQFRFTHNNIQEKGSLDLLSGNNTIFRVSALKSINGYTPLFMTNYEDMDISMRLRTANYELIADPSAIARHQRQDTFSSILKTIWKWDEPECDLHGVYIRKDRFLAKLNFNVKNYYKSFRELVNARQTHLIGIEFARLVTSSLNDFSKYLSANSCSELFYTISNEILTSVRNILIQKACLNDQLLDQVMKLLSKTIITPDFNQSGNTSDVDFLLSLTRNWIQAFESFSATKVIWDMIRVSFERIIREENNPPVLDDSIVLLNIPWNKGDNKGIRAGSRWPFTMRSESKVPHYLPFPFFLAYATSLLKREGFNAHIIDAIAEGLTDEEALERIRGINPKMIFIETAATAFHVDLHFARRLKTILPNCVIVFGGPIMNSFGEAIMASAFPIDYGIAGEYEFALLELAQALRNNDSNNLKNIPGIIYRTENQIFKNPVAYVDINQLPWPERETLPMYNYVDMFAGMTFPMGNLLGSRGCPYYCDFCVWIHDFYNHHKYRFRDINDVVNEAKWMVEKYGFSSLYFDDDTFNIGDQRIQEIARKFMDNNLHVAWGAMCRADGSSYETLKIMKKSGLTGIKFGVESGNQELVNALGKNLSIDKVREATAACKQLGIKVHLTFSIGVTGETMETIEETIQLALELDPDTAQFSLNTPFPGTPAFNKALTDGLIVSEEWFRYDGNTEAVSNHKNLTHHQVEEALKRASYLFEQNKLAKQGTCE